MKLLIMKIEFRIYYLVDELSRATLAWAIWKIDDLHRRNRKRESEAKA